LLKQNCKLMDKKKNFQKIRDFDIYSEFDLEIIFVKDQKFKISVDFVTKKP